MHGVSTPLSLPSRSRPKWLKYLGSRHPPGHGSVRALRAIDGQHWGLLAELFKAEFERGAPVVQQSTTERARPALLVSSCAMVYLLPFVKIQRYDPCLHRSDLSLAVSDMAAAVSVRRQHPSRLTTGNGAANGMAGRGTSGARAGGADLWLFSASRCRGGFARPV